MAHLPTQPQGNPTVLASDHWFNGNVRVYGELWNDRANIGSVEVENLKVTESVVLEGVESLDVDGPATFNDTATFNGPATFNNTVVIDELVSDYLVVNKRIDVGSDIVIVGDDDDSLYSSRNGRIGIGNTIPEQRLDIDGSIKIDENIYDSTNNAGTSGFFLSRDAAGIRWVSVAPGEGEGILVQNEGVTVGAGQSFGTLNFIGTESGGDIVSVVANPNNPQIADISILSFWVKDTGVGGLSTSSPVVVGDNSTLGYTFRVVGSSNITGFTTFGSSVSIGNNLDVTGSSNFYSDASFFDDVIIFSTTNSTTTQNGALQVKGGVGIVANLNVGGFSRFNSDSTFDRTVTIDSNLQATTVDTGALTVEGGVGIKRSLVLGEDLIVGGISAFTQTATFASNVVIESNINSTSPTSGALQVNGGVGILRDVNIGGNLDVDGDAFFKDDVFVDDNVSITGELGVIDVADFFSSVTFYQNLTVNRQSSLDDVLVAGILTVTSQSEKVEINTKVFINGDVDLDGFLDVETNLNVGGIATVGPLFVNGDIDASGFLDLDTNLNVGGISTVGPLFVNGDIDASGFLDLETNLNVGGISTVGPLFVNGDSSFSANITDVKNINSAGIITSQQLDTTVLLSDFSVTGLTTIGVGTVNNDFFVGQNLGVGNNLRVEGTSEFIGNAIFRGGTIGIGDSTGDDIAVSGEFISDLIPNDDDTYSLGREGKQWKDLYLNGTANLDDVKIEESLIDSNDNVGYANTQYKVPRSVLGSVAVDDQGEVITDRFFDAANQIRLNLDFIAEEAVGYIIGPDYKSGPLFTMQDLSLIHI